MRVTIPMTRDGYRTFLKVKSLPQYRFVGREAFIPDEYAGRMEDGYAPALDGDDYDPLPALFDYQRDIARLAIRKRKFAAFMDCGLGKSLVMLEFMRHAAEVLSRGSRLLMVSPLMVIPQTVAEAGRFYGTSLPIEVVKARDLPLWLRSGSGLAITNYDGLTDDLPSGTLGALALDESSMLKGMYGKWGQACLRLGAGVSWKIALTGTPAPNDRIEYANHAVFLDAFPTVNSFLSRYFVNRGNTDNRWEMKPHATGPFFKALSHWCIFLNDPATYGWKDNVHTTPPINVHIHEVGMTDDQKGKSRDLTGTLFACDPGGIGVRARQAKIAKTGDSLKPAFIKGLIDSWPDESTLVWCRFNDEQDRLAAEIPGSASMTGSTPVAERARMIEDFKAGRVKTLISKGKILGFGLNLQVATRQVFSSLHDSFEEYYQCVKRSNRVGSTRELNVHIPVVEVERPMIENVLRKAARVQEDTATQERIFKECGFHDF